MNDHAIQVENLVKYYDSRLVLDGIDLAVPKGCIYGLLGRNGAGKTTLIRMLLGLDAPTRGQSLLLAKDSQHLSAADRGSIGYVAEGHHLIQNYKVAHLAEICKKLSLRWNDQFFAELIEKFRLPMNRKVSQLSTGMRAELNLALAIAIDPEILILDDPTLGLDTVARRQFLALAIDLLQSDSKTILFSSHILSDVERIADRIGILAGGKLVVDCTLDELKTRVKKLRIIFDGQPPEALHMTEVINCLTEGREMLLTVANYNQQKNAVLKTFNPKEIIDIPMTLEDIFIECTQVPSKPLFAK
jgi:ABC-2 type transport system ATP-binding protein